MKTERQEELEMLIEKTRDNIIRFSEKIQRLNYEDSYVDQSYISDLEVCVERLKKYQDEIAEL